MTGKEVADKWFDQFGTGMRQSRLELAAMIDAALDAEREACAALVDAWPDSQRYTSDRATYGVEMATYLADAIRARSNR